MQGVCVTPRLKRYAAEVLLDLCLIVAHMTSLTLLATMTASIGRLPSVMSSKHSIYEHLDTAAARIMLPHKARNFAVLADDSYSTDSANTDGVPVCGSDMARTHQVSQMPLWSLPDDDRGLNDLSLQLVREFLHCLAGCKAHSSVMRLSDAGSNILTCSRILRTSPQIVLCGIQENVAIAARHRALWASLQSVLILLMLMKWTLEAHVVPSFSSILSAFKNVAVVVAELLCVAGTVCTVLGIWLHCALPSCDVDIFSG
jgi:hypothetical protein